MALAALGAPALHAQAVDAAAPSVSAATPTAPQAQAQAADPASAQALHALFARSWEHWTQRYPEWSTYRGDRRFDDRLAEVTPESEAADFARLAADRDAALAVPVERLSPADRLSRELFIRQAEQRLAMQPYAGWRSLSIGALWGVQTEFAELMQVQPMGDAAAAERLLARMAAYPRRIDQEIARLRRGMALGWVSPQPVLDRALASLDTLLAAAPDKSPFLAPFARVPATMPTAERERLSAAGRAAVDRQVLPALRRLREFIVAEYRPKAPASGALSGYPDGPAVYDMLVRQQTTTDISAAEVHAVGLRELARLRGEMEAVIGQTGFQGDFAAFVRFLNTDPRFFHTSGEALLAGYQALAKRIDAELPRLFAELPRAPYGVRGMPGHASPDRAEYYNGPDRAMTRPGWFNANLAGFRTRPIWGMATLTAHEAVPGHHLQIARALELRDLPEFRRQSFGYTAFTEGWALYAETLGREIGLYDDPYALFGHLQWQAFRAARLVVDTGIHALGWSRERAVQTMVERTGVDRAFVESEVDRYTSQPGQALAYMIGQLKIRELRDRAQARLGDRFDVRRFHNAVLDNGALPLSTLQALVQTWIDDEARRATTLPVTRGAASR